MKPTPSQNRCDVQPETLLRSAMLADRAIVRLVGPAAACVDFVRRYCDREKSPLIEVDFSEAPIGSALYGFMTVRFLEAFERATRAARFLRAYRDTARKIGVAPNAPHGLGIPSILRALEFASEGKAYRPVIHLARIDDLSRAGEHGRSMTWALRNEIQHHRRCCYVVSGDAETYWQVDGHPSGPFLHLGARIALGSAPSETAPGISDRQPPTAAKTRGRQPRLGQGSGPRY